MRYRTVSRRVVVHVQWAPGQWVQKTVEVCADFCEDGTVSPLRYETGRKFRQYNQLTDEVKAEHLRQLMADARAWEGLR
jgi:hypothetical protein